MEIVIGATPYVGMSDKKRKPRQGAIVEARMLNIRYPRRQHGRPPSGERERRVRRSVPDPSSGRIVTLLVPDGYSLPKDVSGGSFKVLMRFVPER